MIYEQCANNEMLRKSTENEREKKRWFREIRAARCGLFLRRKYDYIIYDERF